MPWSILPALNALSRRPRPQPHRIRRRAACEAWSDGAGVATPALDDGRPVCGWFDSSHELSRGLRVTELAQPEAVAQLVPLRWWLAWELDAASAAPPPVPPGRTPSA